MEEMHILCFRLHSVDLWVASRDLELPRRDFRVNMLS